MPANAAMSEFTFRYLYPPAGQAPAALDEFERRLDLSTAVAAEEPSIDVEPQFRTCVLGSAPGASLHDRLITLVLAAQAPARITPHSAYGIHGCHPSPRAYYPLQCVLTASDGQLASRLDLAQLALVAVSGTPALDAANSATCLWVKVDFGVYAAFYDLFRKSLYALEVGHLVAELVRLGGAFGLEIRTRVSAQGVRLDIEDLGAPPAEAMRDALQAHMRFARDRNSGRVGRALCPALHRFSALDVDDTVGAIQGAIADASARFPVLSRHPVSAHLCLQGAQGLGDGIAIVDGQGQRFSPRPGVVEECQALFGYDHISFATLPGVMYLCVPEEAFVGPEEAVTELNCALGYVSQILLRHEHGRGNFGRPFRSYDQFGTDILLGARARGERTYYGLLLGRNRAYEAMAVLR